MTDHAVITLEKPLPHLGLSDWHGRTTQLRNVADTRREDSFNVRQSAKELRNETNVEMRWNTFNTNNALADRIGDLNRWHAVVKLLVERVEREVNYLLEEKSSTERELDLLYPPLGVVSECLTQRDGRRGSELTYDDGDTELKKELCIIENNQRLLRDQCHAAWEKLNRLEEVKFKLSIEVVNKKEAEEIDVAQLDLHCGSASITFKPDPTRVPKNSCTHESWLEHTQNIKQLAENELADTFAIRESLFVCREKSRNTLRSQQDRTDHTLRRRIFETQRARNELEWQKSRMKEEMENCICEIKALEKALHEKTNALRLAESRLENRSQRSGMELCIDEPHSQLCIEVQQLRRMRQTLAEKIDCTKTTHAALEDHALRIDKDLSNKQHSLMVDIRGLEMRSRLKSDEFAECSGKAVQTARNIQLTSMEDTIPP